MFLTSFGQDGIDVASPTIAFDVAAVMGRQAGSKQCEYVYKRCQTPFKQLLEAYTL